MSVETEYTWVETNSPAASSRTDDIWFFDDQRGWLINSDGNVMNTLDGGETWEKKFFLCPSTPGHPYLRCMGWAHEQVGWFGAVTRDKDGAKDYLDTLLHSTTDGGETWTPVRGLPLESPAGICGFYAVNERVAYGSGPNDPNLPGPGILKTINGGLSWTHIPMIEHADNLIDIYFIDEMIGWVVGGKIDPSSPIGKPGYEKHPQYEQLKPVVLKTMDGGLTWENKAANVGDYECGEWGWKIQFLKDENNKPKDIGFVSLENLTSAAILKTTDGGESWERLPIANSAGKIINNNLEGIGFINESEGWVGGWGNDFTGLLNSFTTDGGKTWVAQNNKDDSDSDPRIKINRYRFLRAPVMTGYCSGQKVYKLCFNSDEAADARSLVSQSAPIDNFALSYTPDDENISVRISYTLPMDAEKVYIGIWNHLAVHVKTIVDGDSQAAGEHTVVWDGPDNNGNMLNEGLYICRMSVNSKQGASLSIQLPLQSN